MRNCAFWRPNPGSREAQVRKWLVVSRADGGVCELVGSRSRTLRVFNLTPPGDSCGVQNGREEGSPRRPHPPPKGAGGGGRNAAAAAGDRRALEPAPPRSEGAGWPGRPSGCPSVWGQGSGTGPRAHQRRGPCGSDTGEERDPPGSVVSFLTMAQAARLPVAGPARGGARQGEFDFGADPAPGAEQGRWKRRETDRPSSPRRAATPGGSAERRDRVGWGLLNKINWLKRCCLPQILKHSFISLHLKMIMLSK